MSGRIHGARLALRAASTTPGLSLLTVAVVALLSFGGALAPVLLQTAATATVRAALDDVPPATLDLAGAMRGVAEAGVGASEEDAWQAPLELVDGMRAALVPDGGYFLGDPRLIVSLDPSPTTPLDGSARPLNAVTLSIDPRIRDRAEFVEGAAPAPRASGPVEIALSRAVSEELQWPVGETRKLPLEPGVDLELTVSGLFEARDATDGDWAHHGTALEAAPIMSPSGDVIRYATVFAAPEKLTAAYPWAEHATTTAWFPLRADAITGQAADEVAVALRGAANAIQPFHVRAGRLFQNGLAFRSEAPDALEQGLARAGAMTAVTSVIAVGPLTVAMIALGLTGRILALRRVASVRLARARGASGGRLVALLGGEGAVLGAIGAVLGTGAALALAVATGQTPQPVMAAVPVLLTATVAVALPAAALRAETATGREDLGVAEPAGGRRRLLVEAAVLAGAVAVVVLVAQRAAPAAGFDPLLATVPLALTAVGALLAVRLVPAVLGRFEERGRRGTGMLSLVGPARARRDPVVRSAPVFAVVVGIATALFSVAFGGTVGAGITSSAQQQVGADIRLQGPYMPEERIAAVEALDGVRAVAPVLDDDRLDGDIDGRDVRVHVYVVDTAALAEVQRGSAGALPTPDALRAPGGDAVPVVASAALVDELGGSRLEFERAAVEVVAVGPTRSALGPAEPWVMVDASRADDLLRWRYSPGVLLIAVDEGADVADVAEHAVAEAGAEVTARTPEGVAERLNSDPALITVTGAIVAATAVVAALLGVVVAVVLLLGVPARRRVLALLATQGHPARRALALILWEIVPALLVALPFGIVAGAAMPYVVIPALDLRDFVGAVEQPAVRLDAAGPLLVVAGFVVFGALAVGAAAALAARASVVDAIRLLDEEG